MHVVWDHNKMKWHISDFMEDVWKQIWSIDFLKALYSLSLYVDCHDIDFFLLLFVFPFLTPWLLFWRHSPIYGMRFQCESTFSSLHRFFTAQCHSPGLVTAAPSKHLSISPVPPPSDFLPLLHNSCLTGQSTQSKLFSTESSSLYSVTIVGCPP